MAGSPPLPKSALDDGFVLVYVDPNDTEDTYSVVSLPDHSDNEEDPSDTNKSIDEAVIAPHAPCLLPIKELSDPTQQAQTNVNTVEDLGRQLAAKVARVDALTASLSNLQNSDTFEAPQKLPEAKFRSLGIELKRTQEEVNSLQQTLAQASQEIAELKAALAKKQPTAVFSSSASNTQKRHPTYVINVLPDENPNRKTDAQKKNGGKKR